MRWPWQRKAEPTQPRRQLAARRPAPGPGSQYSFSEQFDRLSVLGTGVAGVATLLSAERQADQGFPALQCDLFEARVQMDLHLQSVLDERNEGVARKPWAIREGGDNAADKMAAQILGDHLRGVTSFRAALEHQLTANPYGYALSEIDWQYDLATGYVLPMGFANPPHRRFVFGPGDVPRLWDSMTPAGTTLIPGKWWYTRRKGRLAAAAGLLRGACIWSHFKSLAVRDWLTFSDRFGIPYVTGSYEENVSDDEKAILRQAVAAVGSDGYATFSKGCEIAITQLSSGSSSAVHPDLIGLCNSEISKLITGATLLLEGGGPGSYALGRVHQGRAFDLKRGDAEWLSESFTEGISKPFIEYNGLDAAAPVLQIYLSLDVSIQEQISIASTCANELGLTIDEDQIRRITMLQRPTGTALTGQKGSVSGPEETPDQEPDRDDADPE